MVADRVKHCIERYSDVMCGLSIGATFSSANAQVHSVSRIAPAIRAATELYTYYLNQ